jgi:hypothetical protein
MRHSEAPHTTLYQRDKGRARCLEVTRILSLRFRPLALRTSNYIEPTHVFTLGCYLDNDSVTKPMLTSNEIQISFISEATSWPRIWTSRTWFQNFEFPFVCDHLLKLILKIFILLVTEERY